ncbi:hypothetical protein [Stenotrophomonas sp. PS02289]|uniref:hypothetical protein n=1 Tax=Stenotrophomonas sp. PS02289 TaxID=2991422 RepID=UPI00249BF069|nr:hypothetical protein [Stenotrophomonas sp. PS02289]
MSLQTTLPYFARRDLLESVTRLLLSGANVTLFAPRRHGKTSFVRYDLLPALHEAGWFAARVDLWRNRDNPELGLVEGLEAVAYAAPPRGSLLRPLNLSSLRATFKVPGVDIQGDWAPATGPTPHPEASLENRLANALHLIAGRGTHALIALDEFQALAGKGSDNFVAAFRTALQDVEGRLSVFFTGSSRDGLMRLFNRAKAPLFRSAESLTLPNLGDSFVDSRADYLEAVAGIEVDRNALKLFFPRLCYTPLFLNEIVRILLVRGSNDLSAAVQEWYRAKFDDEYADWFTALQDVESAVMVWLATSGQKSVYTEEARGAMRQYMEVTAAPTTSRVQTAIRRLTGEQALEPTGVNGEYEIADQGLQIVLSNAVNQDLFRASGSRRAA